MKSPLPCWWQEVEKVPNPKLEIQRWQILNSKPLPSPKRLRAGRLSSKQTQISKVSNPKTYDLEDKFLQLIKSQNCLLSFVFWICLGFRV
jgi:hypothetical protein